MRGSMPSRQFGTLAPMSKQDWGGGNVYLRGKTYWVFYSVAGKMVRESAKTDSAKKAHAFLRDRLSQSKGGELTGAAIQKVLIPDLVDLVVKDYERNGKSVKWARIVANHLNGFFRYHRVAKFGASQVNAYVDHRKQIGRSDSTINRELAILRRGFYLGRDATPPLVSRVPKIQGLTEGRPRTGFFDRETLDRLTAELQPEIAAVARFAFFTGCRKGEILDIRWDWVDLKHAAIALPGWRTKSGEPRIIPLIQELVNDLSDLKAERDELWPESEWVFSRRGRQIKDFYAAWREACKRADLPDATKYLHDMRRSAVRNLIRAGVPERVAMAISGHKTRSVFERYNIVSSSDLKDAVNKLEKSFTKDTQKKAKER